MEYLVTLAFFLVPVGCFGTLVGVFATDGFGLAAGVVATGVLIASTF